MPRTLSPRPRAQPRRDALLDAAVEVVGRHGLAGTTHRTVTEAAGVPLATASYYFSSIGELVAEALTRFVRARAAQMEIGDLSAIADLLTPADIATSFADRVMDLVGRLVPEAERPALWGRLFVEAQADWLTPADRAERGGHSQCIAGALSLSEYEQLLAATGLTGIAIELTGAAADGMHAAIIRASKPTGAQGDSCGCGPAQACC